MPEVFRKEGYVCFFYANEGQEPMHVHIRRGGGYAKFWIEPISLEHSDGLKVRELARAEELVRMNVGRVKEKWNEVFNR
jgi:hypothetical protein